MTLSAAVSKEVKIDATGATESRRPGDRWAFYERTGVSHSARPGRSCCCCCGRASCATLSTLSHWHHSELDMKLLLLLLLESITGVRCTFILVMLPS